VLQRSKTAFQKANGDCVHIYLDLILLPRDVNCQVRTTMHSYSSDAPLV